MTIIIILALLVVLVAVFLTRVVAYGLDQTPPLYIGRRDRRNERPLLTAEVSEPTRVPVMQQALQSPDGEVCKQLPDLKRAARRRR